MHEVAKNLNCICEFENKKQYKFAPAISFWHSKMNNVSNMKSLECGKRKWKHLKDLNSFHIFFCYYFLSYELWFHFNGINVTIMEENSGFKINELY